MSLSQIINSIPADYFESYKTFLMSEPIKAKSIASGSVFFLGDLISQLKGGKTFGNLDRLRAIRAGMFGLLIHGTYRHYFYQGLDRGFEDYGLSQYNWAWVPKIAIDELCTPINYGMFLGWNGLLQGKSFQEMSNQF